MLVLIPFREENILESCGAQPLTSGVLLHDNLLPLSGEEGSSCTLNFMSRIMRAIILAMSVKRKWHGRPRG